MPILADTLYQDDDPAAWERLYPEPPLDQWGRYKLDGDAYTRATTIAKALDSTFLLDRWHERQLLNGMRLPALQYQLAALAEDDRDGLNKLASEAKARAGANDRAAIGTAIHRVLERVDTGRLRLEAVPQLVRGDVVAATTVLARNGLTPMQGWVEAVVANPKRGYAGTIDRLMRLDSAELVALIRERLGIEVALGSMVVVDLKTSRTLDWSYDTFAMQVALYTQATHYWDRGADRLMELPWAIERQVAFILWVPAGESSARLYMVRLVPEAQEAIDLAMEVRRLAGFGKAATVLADEEDPAATLMFRAEVLRMRAQRIIELVPQAAPVIAAKFGSIPTFVEARARKHRYSLAELDTIDAILSEGEAAMELPLISDEELARSYGSDQLSVALMGEDRPADVDQPPPTVEQQRWAEGDQTDPMPPDPPEGFPHLPPPDASASTTAIVCGPAGCQTIEAPTPNYRPDDEALADAEARGLVVPAGTPTCIHCRWPMVEPYVHADDCPTRRPVQDAPLRDSSMGHLAGGPHSAPSSIDWYGDPDRLKAALAPGSAPTPQPAPEPVRHPDPPRDDLSVAVDAVRGAFLGSTVVATNRPMPEELRPLLDRLAQLPRDLRGKMDAWAARRAIPNLGTARTTAEQVAMVRAELEAIEEELAARVLRLNETIPSIEHHGAIYAHVGLGPYLGADQLTADEIEAMVALVDAYGRGWLQESQGTIILTEDAKKALATLIKSNHGGAQAAKLACARWAGALGRPKEWKLTTIKEMSSHPVIGPVMGLGPAIHTPDAKVGAEDAESSD